MSNEDNLFGWAIVDKNGCMRDMKPVITEFFGEIQNNDALLQENVRRYDDEWPGLAPHKVVTLYTIPPDTEKLKAEIKELKYEITCNEEDYEIRKELDREDTYILNAEIRKLKEELAAAKEECRKLKEEK